jgi:hypothetical protein
VSKPVINLRAASTDRWWKALERLVSTLEYELTQGRPNSEAMNDALAELRLHKRAAAQSDPKAQIVARLFRVLA